MRRPDAPALAILDWIMPGLTGVEVCRRVRSLPSDEPPYRIVLTSMAEKADIVAGLEAGADDYLAKPFDPGELRARVDVGRRMTELQARLREARDALAHAAMHDPLTGALNRRAFADVLFRGLSEERRHHHGLALGICDVDEFKKVNDTYGHQVGDEVLCGLVSRLAGRLRGHDVLGRYGGDEFVVLTEHVGSADPTSLYERLRASVADHPFATTAGELSITISFGASVWNKDDSGDDLFAAADESLYRAKRAGRNRVVLAKQSRAS
jgi:diguanylate cyclase (GGDEF)-like protein